MFAPIPAPTSRTSPLTTFAQYEPFYFYAQQFMHAILHLPVNHDGSRLLTLIYWTLSGLLAMCFVYRLTGSRIAASTCYLVTFGISAGLRNEPGHPQEVVLVLSELALLLTLFARGRRPIYALTSLGLIAAFLCLTKINIGIFFIAAVVLTCSSLSHASRLRNRTLLAVSGLAALMPVALMHNYLVLSHTYAQIWSSHFCLLASVSIAALCFAAKSRETTGTLDVSGFKYIGAGFALGACGVLSVALLQGISARALLEGIILAPLRHPSVFYVPLWISGRHLSLGCLIMLGTVCLHLFKPAIVRYKAAIGRLKILVGVACMYLLLTDSQHAIWIVFPAASLLLWQPDESPSLAWKTPRLFLCYLLVFEFLQAFPVAGSQLSIALTPAAAWSCLLIYDGLALIDVDYAPARIVTHRRAQILLLAMQLLLMLQIWRCPFNVRVTGPTLDFPGATHIHVTQEQADIYKALVGPIQTGCDVLFTMPGMGSLNLFSGVPTPNGHNLTAWMTGFTPVEQQAIVSILHQSRRPCVAYNAELVKGWMPGGPGPLTSSPIAAYVFAETRPLLTVSGFELRVPITQP